MKLDNSLYKAQVQQLQLLLETQFRKNIAFFASKAPRVAETYENYTPSKVKLQLSDEGYLNLFNITLNNKPVYAYDPQQFCQDYVDEYAKLPNFYRVKNVKPRTLDRDNIVFMSTICQCLELLENQPTRLREKGLEDTTDTVLLNGIGLGYLIPQLLEKTDIRNLIVIEPHKDIFYASMHILDWEQVYENFEQPGYSIKLIVGESTNSTVHLLWQHFNRIGMHHALNTFAIDHLSSKEMSDITSTFFERLGTTFLALGYFDDEQMGLAHTIENWRQQIPPLREHALLTKDHVDLPVFVIGNGPSLDHAKDFLIENQNKAIIISCGTTSGSLKRMGIKPDFHVEQERNLSIYEWLTASTDDEFRQDIILLALNTVHPEIFKLFETRGMAMKQNDLGTHFFSKYIPDNQHTIRLGNCNPTVTNAGMAFAAALGFTEVYLFGVDLGYTDGRHHSSESIHYSFNDTDAKELKFRQHDDDENLTQPGNFGKNVVTDKIFMGSRISFEAVLKTNQQITCYNVGDGLFIEHTKPVHAGEIKLDYEIENKRATAKDIFDRNFYIDGLEPIESSQKIKELFQPAILALGAMESLFHTKQDNWEKALLLLDQQHQVLLQLGLNQKSQYAYTLLKGSIVSFNIQFGKALHLGENREESLELYNSIRKIYLDFLKGCRQKIESDLLTFDEAMFGLKSRIYKD